MTLLDVLEQILNNPPLETNEYLPTIFIEYKSVDPDRQKRITDIETTSHGVEFEKAIEREIEFVREGDFQIVLSSSTPARIGNGYECEENCDFDGVATYNLISVEEALKFTNVVSLGDNVVDMFISKYFQKQSDIPDCY
jgi:hypothetical protein